MQGIQIVRAFPMAAAFMLLLLCIACRHTQGTSGAAAKTAGEPSPPRVSLPEGAMPLRTTNEVLRIAYQVAQKHRFRLATYACDSLAFELRETNGGNPNRWVAHFLRKPPTPDSDFFVLIDDATAEATLWHP
jgi:hypothetical protein